MFDQGQNVKIDKLVSIGQQHEMSQTQLQMIVGQFAGNDYMYVIKHL